MLNWARICKLFKEPRNRLPTWLGCMHVYKYGLSGLRAVQFEAWWAEPVFVNLSLSLENRFPTWRAGTARQPYLSYRPARLQYIGWQNRFLGCINVYKYGLRVAGAAQVEAWWAEPVFVNFWRSPGIDSQPGVPVYGNPICRTGPPSPGYTT